MTTFLVLRELRRLLLETKEITEKLFQNKFWRFKKDFYLCSPNGNEGPLIAMIGGKKNENHKAARLERYKAET